MKTYHRLTDLERHAGMRDAQSPLFHGAMNPHRFAKFDQVEFLRSDGISDKGLQTVWTITFELV